MSPCISIVFLILGNTVSVKSGFSVLSTLGMGNLRMVINPVFTEDIAKDSYVSLTQLRKGQSSMWVLPFYMYIS